MSIPSNSRCFHGLLPSRSGAEGHLSIQAALEDRDFMVIFVWLNGYFYGTQWWFLYGNVWDLINGIKCWWFGWTGLAGASWSFWSTLVNLGIRGHFLGVLYTWSTLDLWLSVLPAFDHTTHQTLECHVDQQLRTWSNSLTDITRWTCHISRSKGQIQPIILHRRV